jgi:hypothetical protein
VYGTWQHARDHNASKKPVVGAGARVLAAPSVPILLAYKALAYTNLATEHISTVRVACAIELPLEAL